MTTAAAAPSTAAVPANFPAVISKLQNGRRVSTYTITDVNTATMPAMAEPHRNSSDHASGTGKKAEASTPMASPAMPLKAIISRESHDFLQPKNDFHILDGLPRCSTAAPSP